MSHASPDATAKQASGEFDVSAATAHRPSTARRALAAARHLDALVTPGSLEVSSGRATTATEHAVDGEGLLLRMGKKVGGAQYALISVFQVGTSSRLRFVVYVQESCTRYELKGSFRQMEGLEAVDARKELARSLVGQLELDGSGVIVFAPGVEATWVAT